MKSIGNNMLHRCNVNKLNILTRIYVIPIILTIKVRYLSNNFRHLVCVTDTKYVYISCQARTTFLYVI